MDYLKIINQPLSYQINLLTPSNWFYLSIYYQAGYVFEDKPNNLPYVFEHYLVNILIKKGVPENCIKAYTDEEYIEFDFRFSRKDLLKYFKIIIDNIANLDVSCQNILDQEKKIIDNEINKKNNDPEIRRHYLISEQLLGKDCPYVKAHDYSQANLIQEVTLNDLSRFYNSRIRSLMPVICFGGYQIDNDEIRHIRDLISSVNWGSQNKVSFPQCYLATNQVKDIQDKSVTNGIYLVFAFSIPNSDTIGVIQRKAIKVLLQDIRNHSSQYSLNATLRKIGIYMSDLEIYLSQNLGYFYYSIFGNYGQELAIVKTFQETIENWKDKNILLPIITESVQDVCSKRSTDYDNEARFYNFSDVLATDRTPLNDKQYVEALNNLNSKFWADLTNSLFDWKKMSIFVIHYGCKDIDIRKLRHILF